MADEIRNDKEVVVVNAKIEGILAKAEALVIKDEMSNKLGTDLVAFLKRAYNKLEERRKWFVKPLQDHVKDINNEFKVLIEPVDKSINVIKSKQIAYSDLLDQRAREEAAKKQVDTEKLATELGIKPVEVVAAPVSTQTRGSLGMTTIQKRWTFRVVDQAKVPDEYKEINSVKVRAAINGGMREISGLEIFQEKSVAVR